MGRLRKLIALSLVIAMISIGIVAISPQEIASQISKVIGGAVAQVCAECKGLLLKTGQTTQYNSELDDGFYEMGLAKLYTVLTTGQYSGTTNIDLIHYTAVTISFVSTTPGTINDAAAQLAQFKTGDVIVITGSANNNGVYNISTGNVAGTIRTTQGTIFEAAKPPISIAKREAHSNNCVKDENTCLTWSRYVAGNMGTNSDGGMPWTGQLYDIFAYCAAANVAALGGYGDWRIPNIVELSSIMHLPTLYPDAAAFPGYPIGNTKSSSTDQLSAGNTFNWNLYTGQTTLYLASALKTGTGYVLLVRGGN